MLKNIVIDVPTLYVGTITKPSDLTALDGKELGYTTDGIKISFSPNVKDIEFDNRNDRAVKGMQRILGWECTAECKGLELSEEAMGLGLLEKDSAFTDTGYTKLVASKVMVYKDLVIVGKTNEAKNIVVVIHDCYNSDGFSMETKDSDEGTYSLKVTATYDPENMDKAPFEIYIPKEA